MRKPHIWLGSLLLASHSVLAGEIAGSVNDSQGRPIPGAIVEVVGTNQRVTANAQGEFVLRDLSTDQVELHVKAPYHTHLNRRINVDADTPVEFTLARSPLEIIDVTALPWHASDLESAMPVDVLAGDALRNRQAATLGDTLRMQLGVHSNYYGPVASSPVIRGLEGPRVLITQNGLDAGDASRVGPDHAVATETSTAQQIEILRGPATLLYGSGAIGGVVNVVDSRVPQDNATVGSWQIQHDTVADENMISGSLTSGFDNFAFHADGFWRESSDYRIPVPAERHHDDDDGHDHDHDDGHGHGYRLDDSAYDASGFNLGGSYLLDNGFVGISYGRLDRTYGIPGHEHDHGHGHDDDDGVYADLTQDRIQLHSELSLNHHIFSSLNTRLGYTEYTHHEIEAGEALTTFDSTVSEARVELQHHPLAHWRGALSVHYKHEDFAAEGIEAFTPPSITESLALALVEERHFGPVQVQLGGRIERVEVRAPEVIMDLDDHDTDGLLSVLSVKSVFEPVSLSAGAVWDFTPGYNVAASISHSQRAPSAAELLSYGAHIGTGAFEVGALFDVYEGTDGDIHVDLNMDPVELETSNNIDVSLKKFEGDFGFTLNAFYNQIDDFYYLSETGLHADDGHGHDHGHDHGDDEGLPVYVFTAQDARLYGFEGQAVWQINNQFRLKGFADYTRASLRGGEDLPRIPPLRLGAQLNFASGNYSAELAATHYFDQSRTAPLETETEGYTLLEAQAGYDFTAGRQNITLYVRGNNLTDQEARPHTSFLKDRAPLPGRSFAAGIRSTF
ncbi:TonB-dependent receptor [Marinimicrobium sp. ABcell2]|uniref:TonB-dependent receptor n=1 Tax=Marinimicrobium sp. ABcell2 TaxID=3069751 RepID=UPI0027AEB67C|nr:TonB-dependent receptor [Marinimicrobium sp. ABcell2]MDQ2077679.1 TonB-dependent receptor [Marinimicrobium sp. ABcell2]